MFGQEPLGGPPAGAGEPKKIFVGSLPDGCQEGLLRNEFSRYGNIEEVYLKPNCEPGRQFAFVTFSYPDQAQAAAAAANGVLHFPGSVKTCEVTLARNQGLFGQGAMDGGRAQQQHYAAPDEQYMAPAAYGGPPSAAATSGARKIFVGSLPDGIPEHAIGDEFSKFGQIADVYLKQGCEPGRQWAFVTFAHPGSAQTARDQCDRKLMFPGAARPCEVTLAKNQGLFGQESWNGQPPVNQRGAPPPQSHGKGGQPPPPATPPPPHLTPWRMYKTVSGIPYYHNHTTGATVWEAPPDLQPHGGARYSPY